MESSNNSWKDNVKLRHYGVVTLVGFVLTLPLILYGLPVASADGVYHAIYYTNFAEQLWSGDLYPRWLSGMNGGLGSPTFFYYPPLAYYLTSLFKPFFVNDANGWYQLGISSSLGLVASGLCAYLWLERISDGKSALIAALLYMLMPYHLTYDLYGRGAFAEFWAFVWMPLILYFVGRVIRDQQLAVVGLAVSFALLIMTHLLTTLMFTLVPICYAFYMAEPRRRIRVAGIAIGAMFLGVGLSAAYVVPAMTTQDFVLIDKMKSGYVYYENWFLPLNLHIDGSLRYFWMIFQVGGLALLAFIIGRLGLTITRKRELTFWTVILMSSIFMMLPLSKFIWKFIPALQMLQFPWRFNTVLCIAALPLLALAVSSIRPPYSRFMAGALVWAIFISLLWIHDVGKKAWQSFSTQVTQPDLVAAKNKTLKLNIDTIGFRPRWSLAKESLELESLLQRIGYSVEGLTKVNIVEGTGTAVVNKWEPREIAFQIDTPTGISLTVSQFYYPGWTARLTGEPYNLLVQPSPRDGLVNISVPSGRHQLLLRLERNRAEYIGQLISGCCLIMTLFSVLLSMFLKVRN